MNPTRREMACAVCLTPLNVLDGRYLHPIHHRTDGHQPVPVPTDGLDTIRRVCDFCGDPQPLWAYTGRDVSVRLRSTRANLLHGFGEVWAACAACTIDIEAGRYRAITERAARRIGLDHSVQAATQRLHTEFLNSRQPGRRLITTTEWADLTLAARDLPRIRDGLTRLARGQLELPATTSIPAQRIQLADSLERARLYWIDATFTDLAEAAAVDLPELTMARALPPGDDGLLVWSRSVAPRGITAASWTTKEDHIWVILYRAIGAGLPDTTLQAVRNELGWLAPMRDQTLRHGPPIAGNDNPAAVLLATWLLIAQGAAQTETAPVDKATRKKYARTRQPAPEIRIVSIRAQHRTSTSSAQPTTRRQYTKRVWVTGHWRNQPYGPGRTLRRPVYIHPHLRGPENSEINLSTTVRVLGRQAAEEA